MPESTAETAKFVVPAVVGDPEILPALLNVNPAGKLPWDTLQVIVPVPPAFCSVATDRLEYDRRRWKENARACEAP